MTPIHLPQGYEAERVLKETAYTRVVVARSRGDRARVVVKTVTADAPERIRNLFLDDVRLRSELIHEGISPILDSGRSPRGLLYAVSPYVERTDPHRWIAREPRSRALAFVGRLAAPIRFLHERGHLHGDIKPSNVLFGSKEGEIGDLCVTDLMPLTFRRGGEFGTLAGTLAYMAPETIRGEDVDHRADLYSFGVTLYEVLAGRPLFEGDAIELAKAHLVTPAHSRLPTRSSVPRALWEAVARLLEKEPRDRFGSVDEFLETVEGKRRRRTRVTVPAVPPFVRRQEVEEKLRSWLDHDDARCLLIIGASGSGRTRLLRRFTDELRFRGCPVVTVAGPKAPGSRPFDGVRRLFSALSDGPIRISPAERAPKERIDDPLYLKESKQEIGLFRRLRERWETLLRPLGADGSAPPIIVVDNADLFDEASMRFLRFLIFRGSDTRARYVLSQRERTGLLVDALAADPTAAGQVRTEFLGPFGKKEVEEWLRGSLGPGKMGPGLVDTAIRLSGGYPANLDRVLQDWTCRRSLRKRRGVFELGVAASQSRESPEEATGRLPLDGLTAAMREVAAGIALAAVPQESSFFVSLLSIPPHEFPALVAPLIERRLLQCEARPTTDVYSPASETVRLKLQALIPENRRRRLHRAAARIAERAASDGDPAPLLIEAAQQWESAGQTRLASRALLRAASCLQGMGLVQEAADTYRRALRLKGGLRTPLERARVIFTLATLRQLQGNPGSALAALRHLQRVVLAVRGGRTLGRRARRLEAWVRFFRGDRADAEHLLGRLLEGGEPLDEGEEASLRCDVAWFALSRGSPEEAREHLHRALALLEGRRAHVLVARALNRLGAVAFYERDWREAGSLFVRAIRTLDRFAPRESAGSLANLALVRFWTGHLIEARQLLEQARDRAREGGDLLEEARIVEDLARVLHRLGKGEEASRALDEAWVIHDDYGDEGGRARVLLSRGQMERDRGRLDQSLHHLTEGLTLARSLGNPYTLFNALDLLAQTRVARGEACDAEAALLEGAALQEGPLAGLEGPLLLQGQARLSLLRGSWAEADERFTESARLFLGRGERLMAAETLLDAAQARSDGVGLPTPRPLLEHAERLLKKVVSPWLTFRLSLLLARYEEARGDATAAEVLYRDAVRTARELDARLYLAEALGRLGALCARHGERRHARAFVEEASSLYGLVSVVSPPAYLAEARALLSVTEGEGGEDFRTLCRIAKAINSIGDSGAILDYVLDQTLDHLRAERGLVLLYGPRGELVPRAARSLVGEDLRDVTRFSRTLFRRAAETEDPIIADNALTDPRFQSAESVTAYNILSVACTPLRSKGKAVGLVYVDNRKSRNVFTSADVAFLRALADLAGVAIENARLMDEFRRENALLREDVERGTGTLEVVAESPAMRAVLRQLRTAAQSDITILLLGETGAGKGLSAHLLHREGPRRDQPFLRLNCSSIVPTLVEDELFGHERGAFTDATDRKAGIFERAHRGTLLLDEIGDMPLTAQTKLLRVLQEGEFERLGGTETLRSNVRIIAATNRNLRELVDRREFREDLFWRLAGLTIEIPPLRARREDIPDLAQIFLKMHAWRNRKDIQAIAGAAESLLVSYDWPGNVRELDHVVERAVVLCEGSCIEAVHLTEEVRGAFPSETPSQRSSGGKPGELQDEVRAAESEALRRALVRTGWNRTQAARLLGIHESTVRKKIRLFRLDRFRTPEDRKPRGSYRRPNR